VFSWEQGQNNYQWGERASNRNNTRWQEGSGIKKGSTLRRQGVQKEKEQKRKRGNDWLGPTKDQGGAAGGGRKSTGKEDRRRKKNTTPRRRTSNLKVQKRPPRHALVNKVGTGHTRKKGEPSKASTKTYGGQAGKPSKKQRRQGAAHHRSIKPLQEGVNLGHLKQQAAETKAVSKNGKAYIGKQNKRRMGRKKKEEEMRKGPRPQKGVAAGSSRRMGLQQKCLD